MIYNQKFVFFAIIFLCNVSLQLASQLPHINKNFSYNLTQSSNIITKVKPEENTLAKSQPIPIPTNKNYEYTYMEENSPASPFNKGYQKLFVGYKEYSHYSDQDTNSNINQDYLNRVSPNYNNDNTPSPLTFVTAACLMNIPSNNNSLHKSQK